MAKKFYAVKNGKNGDGIYDSWEACKAQVHGVKSVVFKGFPTRAEAEDFLQRAGASTTEGEAPENPQREGVAVAYVDGSFSKDTGEFACGAVLFWQGERLLFSQKYNDPDLREMRTTTRAWASGPPACGRPTSPAPRPMPPCASRPWSACSSPL